MRFPRVKAEGQSFEAFSGVRALTYSLNPFYYLLKGVYFGLSPSCSNKLCISK